MPLLEYLAKCVGLQNGSCLCSYASGVVVRFNHETKWLLFERFLAENNMPLESREYANLAGTRSLGLDVLNGDGISVTRGS